MNETLHIVCPHCRVTNLVARARLHDQPKCGKCHNMLFAGIALPLTEREFDLFANASDIPLVVDFWASWCGPCKQMAPAFEQAARSLEPHYYLCKVNVDEQPRLAQRFRIGSIPTLAAFEHGIEVARHAGTMTTQDIVKWVRSVALTETL